ncbi:hypothetical protein [Pendulispora albinea]|uniref:DUF1440 domain-containing protein n=1 Tax=Pendulispora albinea TaxID=2741071 RepID=A0ABZ2LT09_9BACT
MNTTSTSNDRSSSRSSFGSTQSVGSANAAGPAMTAGSTSAAGSIDTARPARSVLRAVLVGGAAAAVLDAADAIVAFKAVLGFDPVSIYQFVASGMLGPSAFEGGIATALLGVFFHTSIAFSAALVYVLASTRLTWLARAYTVWGPIFGLGVWAVMNLIVIPLSKTPPSAFSLPLFLNGIIGHALFVGLPIAYAAHRYLAAPDSAAARTARSAS